jgi:hypothetical protein
MKAPTVSTATEAPSAVQDAVRIRAHGGSIRRLGHWTSARRFDVRASHGGVVLDLRSPRIEPGDVEVALDVDHSMVKLLVPEDAAVEHDEVRRVGRCGFVDWSGGPASGGRLIRIAGEMRRSELRVNRGGVAIVSAMLTRDYVAELKRAWRANHVTSLADVRTAYREGRWTTIDDPGRSA